jgi:ubiquinone/menaquinone biosynthesis C-methylase UbiE
MKRADYDAIAPRYDATPGRARNADPELLAFAGGREAGGLAVLDLCCGTGSQLIADRAALPAALHVGLDRSTGMLREARRKAPDLALARGDAALLPFAPRSFDFVSCQFALHHIADKRGLLLASRAVLRAGGRLVLRNLCPQESADWLYYEYFPEAHRIDLADFWPPAAIEEAMREAGFGAVTTSREHIRYEQPLADWLEIVRRRDTCSQLSAISDAAYAAGVERLERETADPGGPRSRSEHLCLVTIRGEVPEGAA